MPAFIAAIGSPSFFGLFAFRANIFEAKATLLALVPAVRNERHAEAVGKHAPLIEVTEMAVCVAKPYCLVNPCVFGHVLEGGHVRVKSFALALGFQVFLEM